MLDSTNELRAGMPGPTDALPFILSIGHVVSGGPERLRGIWIPEDLARVFSVSINSELGDFVADFYDAMHSNAVLAAHHEALRRGGSSVEAVSQPRKAARSPYSYGAFLED